ncbi:poly-gamma-glutamate synthase PgsB [Cerasibacillus terrae]|uniref:Poly-gamma-glutamate synthase PgsB n=1 Tax=Cerasibacillus terrae TaxID=2498845 RepID=A0A5C8P0D5_9BACI|nr:poly-gamma-glutamate synthase PgsB [Cerasibacillus terrae]TXL66716.1 poly-gamma-glutamate synthase PgsB [Cerasibacillus terrae]
MELFLIIIVSILILFLGWRQKKKHYENINSIPIRINVNGIRGKSTVTRLITTMIIESGLKTVGKTTGTAARMIYWNKEERPIIRRREGPNIGEQRLIVQEAADLGAEALVSECMAVNPDYQITFQDQLLQANIGVIVNVLEDHMDVMGPTLDEVAQAFLATIPYNGTLVTIDGEYLNLFKRVAKKRNTKVIVAKPEEVDEAYLRKFDYMIFPDNVALALGVAEALDIPKEDALEGMLLTPPDPGAMKIATYEYGGKYAHFVNGFAANDPTSTLRIWDRVQYVGYPSENLIVIMNCRDDRVDRTIQFANDVLPYMSISTLILTGSTTAPIVEKYNKDMIKADELLNLEDESMDLVLEELHKRLNGQVIYGIGNIHGSGEPLIHHLTNSSTENSEVKS